MVVHGCIWLYMVVHLKKHQEDKNKSPSYNCDNSDYVTKLEGQLKKYQEKKHEGFGITCKQCEYHTGRSLHTPSS